MWKITANIECSVFGFIYYYYFFEVLPNINELRDHISLCFLVLFAVFFLIAIVNIDISWRKKRV